MHRLSCYRTPKHKMAEASVPTKYWTVAFKIIIFLINCLSSSTVKHKPPRELVFSFLPSLDFLQVFGCSYCPLLSPLGRSKLEYKSVYCIFLGYSAKHKGYCCLESHFGYLFISRHVNFNELHFPIKTNTVSNSSSPRLFQLQTLPKSLKIMLCINHQLIHKSMKCLLQSL
jgi:histone deacetylase 1/2